MNGRSAIFAALLASAAAAQAQNVKPLVVLEPRSEWQVHQAQNSCRLSRNFGQDGNSLAFYMESYAPGDWYFIVAAGKVLKPLAGSATGFTFGAEEAARGRNRIGLVMVGKLGSIEPALMANTQVDGWAGIDWFDISNGKRNPVRLALGPMEQPLELLNTCIDSMVEGWGIDQAAHENLQRKATPKNNPVAWIDMNNFPIGGMAKGAMGVIRFRLIVGKDGKPLQCSIEQNTLPDPFKTATCNDLMSRGEFEPALDAEGQPLVSFFRSTIRFQMP